MATAPGPALRSEFGDIDIYLFDQLQKGRIGAGMKVLDAGCGGGRNLVYFLRNEYSVFAVDADERAIGQVRSLAATYGVHGVEDRFLVADLGDLPFADGEFDVVVSSAVLHFAADEIEFDRMLEEMWRTLKPGGTFFARLASSIGIETRVRPVGGRRALLPDGTERFLVDEAMLKETTRRLGGVWLEPLKTTNVENLRCMTTWVLEKAVK